MADVLKIYISGPIAIDPVRQRAEFANAEILLRSARYDPVNPFLVPACEENDCKPFPQEEGEHSWECFMKYDLLAMLKCDAVAMLPRWEWSPGARLENFVAIQTGLVAWPLDRWLLRSEEEA